MRLIFLNFFTFLCILLPTKTKGLKRIYFSKRKNVLTKSTQKCDWEKKEVENFHSFEITVKECEYFYKTPNSKFVFSFWGFYIYFFLFVKKRTLIRFLFSFEENQRKKIPKNNHWKKPKKDRAKTSSMKEKNFYKFYKFL